MTALLHRITALFLAIFAFFGIHFSHADPAPTEPQTITQEASYTVEGADVTFSFPANPSTGYTWETEIDGSSVQLTKEIYISAQDTADGVAMAGVPGTQTYTYTAIQAGKTTLIFRYLRPWEHADPIDTYCAVITVGSDLSITVASFEAV